MSASGAELKQLLSLGRQARLTQTRMMAIPGVQRRRGSELLGTVLVPVMEDGKEAKRVRLGEPSREGLRERKSRGEKEVILLEA